MIGRTMTFGEAIRLTRILSKDPSTQIFAATKKWEHPFPVEAIILADLIDIQIAKGSDRPQKPYPRPWRVTVKTLGTAMPIAELEATIARARATGA